MYEEITYLTNFSKLQLLRDNIPWIGKGEMTAFVVRNLWLLKACIVPYGIIVGKYVGT